MKSQKQTFANPQAKTFLQQCRISASAFQKESVSAYLEWMVQASQPRSRYWLERPKHQVDWLR